MMNAEDCCEESPSRQKKVSGSVSCEILKQWREFTTWQKEETLQKIHLHVFWFPVVFYQQKNCTKLWAKQLGFGEIDANDELSLHTVHRIEMLETLLKVVERGCLSEDLTKQMIEIGNRFNMGHKCVDEAVEWLMNSGDNLILFLLRELTTTLDLVLAYIFTQYAQYVEVSVCEPEVLLKEWNTVSQQSVEKSEEMKNKGNENFQKGDYGAAVRFYTKAIKFKKAVGDGKRATLIKPGWAKGHYRLCDALFFLGEHWRAMVANERGQEMCYRDPDGVRELQQQNLRFKLEMEINGGRQKNVPNSITISDLDFHIDNCGSRYLSLFLKPVICHTDKTEGGTETDSSCASTEEKSEMAGKRLQKTEPCIQEKNKIRSRQPVSLDKMVSVTPEELRSQLRTAVEDAHSALTDQRCRNAKQSFEKALDLLNCALLKEFDISELDRILLIYGYAVSLHETGQPEELAEALTQFHKLKDIGGRQFQCLIYFGIGKVLFKENRFSEALENFKDALLMVKRQIVPGKLTWPTTKVIVQETQTDHLKNLLEQYIEMCKFPPKPDAVCRHQSCIGHSKIEIYFNDPDFKGFIRLICCQSCNVEFHISCWKKMKTVLYNDRTEKDFLHEACFTPDCSGKICHIVIYGSTGLVKCEFESSVSKTTVPAKLKFKQKCTSLKKLKAKEEQKIRRKQPKETNEHENAEQTRVENNSKQNSADELQNNVSTQRWLIFGDRVLQQINERKELFKKGTVDISVFLEKLQPWIDIIQKKGNTDCLPCLKSLETLEDVADLVLQSKNRVLARVLVELLNNSVNIDRKLWNWASHLNAAGLSAAEKFIEQHADHLEQLDLASLLSFEQDILVEKFGIMPEFFTGAGLTIIEYIKQASAQEMRVFIWLLEENRDQFQSCHHALNEYFEIMDGVCVVIKKTENEKENNSPVKSRNRGRKKKHKDLKHSVIVLSGPRGGSSREDDDDFFTEENSLFLLGTNEPFIIPDHLRDQVTHFEGQYVNRYKRILDNNIKTDPTTDSLYDYFAQIFEEHGPLEAHDPLLVGELENFPVEAQARIRDAGGLKEFLVGSLRFVTMDSHIGLMKHAVSLQHRTVETDHSAITTSSLHMEDFVTKGPFPNPSAKEFQPLFLNGVQTESNTCMHVEEVGFGNSITDYSQTFINASNGHFSNQYGFYPAGGAYFTEPYSENLDCGSFPDVIENTQELLKKNVSVQTICEIRDEVAVNTEPYEPFETDKGDLLKKEKDNTQMEKKIEKMEKDYMVEQERRKEQIFVLEEEVKKINQYIEIANKELEMVQRDLEEEVRKDQQEKKDNQETMKALKAEIKELTDSCEILSKNITEKKKKYEEQLTHFLETRQVSLNQSAAEKMSLEDEIKRYQDLCARAALRSQAAEMYVLANRRQFGLLGFHKYVSEKEMVLNQMTEILTRYDSSILKQFCDDLQAGVRDAKEKIRWLETQYKEQMEQLKSGIRLSSLPLLPIPNPLPTPLPQFVNLPPVLHYLDPLHPPFASNSTNLPPVRQQFRQGRTRVPTHVASTQRGSFPGRGSPLLEPGAGVTRPQPLQGPRVPPPQHVTIYENIIHRLSGMFPHYSRPVLEKFIQEVRTTNGGTLNNLSYEEAISRVAQLILDHQENTRQQMSSSHTRDPIGFRLNAAERRTPSPRSGSPASINSLSQPTQAWKTVGSQQRFNSTALNVEDPCIICHEEMSSKDLCVLECRHSFHRECIKSWLKEQSTCPTCREHALLPEDFPLLPGRIRRGHAPAAFF
ncbi:E3 ubiquitin-protein ligase TTC3 [Arapaima gigas]